MHAAPPQLQGAVPPPLRARDGTAWQPEQEPMEFGTEDGTSFDGSVAPPPSGTPGGVDGGRPPGGAEGSE